MRATNFSYIAMDLAKPDGDMITYGYVKSNKEFDSE